MSNHSDILKFHLWIPSIFSSKGGIQVYSAFFLHALQELYQQSQYEVFLKHDTQPKPGVASKSETRYHFCGSYPLKARTPFFAAKITWHGLVQRPNLVIATHLNFSIAAHWLKKVSGTPYWIVAHGIEAWNIQNPTLKTALNHADRILAVSHYTRERLLQEQSLDPKKVVVLHNTFDVNRFRIAAKPCALLKRYNLSPEQPIILTVARLSKDEQYKGYDKILTALPQVRQAIPNVHYVLVGKGDDQPRLKELISKLQLEGSVTLTGYIPDEELGAHYNLCDVFAMPSKGEGFGIVYLEALASGKPVLGGNRDGALDALCQGDLGALVNPDDTLEISQTLIQILLYKYANVVLYQPDVLRQKVIEQFGFERFQKTLGSYIENYI